MLPNQWIVGDTCFSSDSDDMLYNGLAFCPGFLLTHALCLLRFCVLITSHLVTMLIILAFIILFHITAAVLLFISTLNNVWWVSGTFSMDLWYTCNDTCRPTEHSESTDAAYLQAVQATMILATILCCVGFFVFILQLFRLKQGERFVFTAIIQLLSAFCVMIGASIYTAKHGDFQKPTFANGDYGYAFVIAWIAFPLILISGLMYLVLRKRK